MTTSGNVEWTAVQLDGASLFYGTELVVALLYGTERKLLMYNTSIMFLWHLLLQMCNKYKMNMLQGRCTAEILTKVV